MLLGIDKRPADN
jgi:hypothetical protein